MRQTHTRSFAPVIFGKGACAYRVLCTTIYHVGGCQHSGATSGERKATIRTGRLHAHADAATASGANQHVCNMMVASSRCKQTLKVPSPPICLAVLSTAYICRDAGRMQPFSTAPLRRPQPSGTWWHTVSCFALESAFKKSAGDLGGDSLAQIRHQGGRPEGRDF